MRQPVPHLVAQPPVTLELLALHAACGDSRQGPGSGTVSGAQALISDQLHSGGQAGFFWLAPIVANPNPDLFGDFVYDANPTVEIDEVLLPSGSFVAHIATLQDGMKRLAATRTW